MQKVVALCTVLLVPMAFAQDADSPYLRAALQTANYLATLERAQTSGVAWPAWDGPSAFVSTGLDSGAAGIGFFYLRLYRATGEKAYLNKARQAADFVYREYQAGNAWHDWLSGVAGGGEFFLALYSATADAAFLDRAAFAGDWLVRNAIADASGYHWEFRGLTNVYTSLAHGSGGVALFLARLYQQTGNATYLEYAEGAVRWMRQFMVPLGDSAIGWKRLTTDTQVYNGWCGGSAGVYFILKKLWEVTGKGEYRVLMLDTARGLLAGAQWQCPGGGPYSPATGCPGGALPQAAWAYSTPASGSYPEVVCHGVASMVFVLFDAYGSTLEATFLQAARAGVRWLKAVAQNQQQGLRWEHIYGSGLLESGFLTGTASIGHAFLRFARFDTVRWTVPSPVDGRAILVHIPDPSYLEPARAAGDFLLSLADHPQPDQTRWINLIAKPAWDTDPVRYETGWYSGAAGVGIFLLELHDAIRGIRPAADELSPLNP